MLRAANVATPFTAVTVLLPDSVPGSSMPPLCPITIVTFPLNPDTTFPAPSTTFTCTAGVIRISGSVVLGCTPNVRWYAGLAGLSASAVASHESVDVKYQFHRGSAVPPFGSTWYSASALIAESPTSVTLVNPGGGSVPTAGSGIVAPEAEGPAA